MSPAFYYEQIIPLWDGVTVRMGMAEEDFEGAFKFNHRSSNYYDACIP
jgi:hypothetical protein